MNPAENDVVLLVTFKLPAFVGLVFLPAVALPRCLHGRETPHVIAIAAEVFAARDALGARRSRSDPATHNFALALLVLHAVANNSVAVLSSKRQERI